MEAFSGHFTGVSDPRAANARHDFLEVIFVALAAVLCGAQDCTDMALFAQAKLDLLRQVLKLKHGAPSHDTFSRVFRRLAPEPFEAAFARFSAAFAGGLKGVVALDGKALRGAYERGRKTVPLHLVNVWAAEARVVIGQRLAPGRNEVLGAQQALALLSLDGCIVTADALHCRADTAQAILDTGADYALAVKANQPTLLAQAQALTAAADPQACAVDGPSRAHDRLERRTALVVPAKDIDFPGIAAVARVETQRTTARGEEPVLVRWFCSLTSSRPSACSPSPEPTGRSRTNSTGCSMSIWPRMPPAAARTTRPKTSRCCANSPSISSNGILTKDPSKGRSSVPPGTIPSSSVS